MCGAPGTSSNPHCWLTLLVSDHKSGMSMPPTHPCTEHHLEHAALPLQAMLYSPGATTGLEPAAASGEKCVGQASSSAAQHQHTCLAKFWFHIASPMPPQALHCFSHLARQINGQHSNLTQGVACKRFAKALSRADLCENQQCTAHPLPQPAASQLTHACARDVVEGHAQSAAAGVPQAGVEHRGAHARGVGNLA